MRNVIYSFSWVNDPSSKFNLTVLVFQALRIFINNELDNIGKFMESLAKFCPEKFEPLCIFIGFHSLEHDAIKKSLRVWDRKQIKYVEKNLKPDWSEVKENNPSRSAKLFSWKVMKNAKVNSSPPDKEWNTQKNAVNFML